MISEDSYGTPPEGASAPSDSDSFSISLRVYSAFEAGVLEQALENFYAEVNAYDQKVPGYMKDTFLETIASLQTRFENAKSRGRVLS